jgi:hypothetical protein
MANWKTNIIEYRLGVVQDIRYDSFKSSITYLKVVIIVNWRTNTIEYRLDDIRNITWRSMKTTIVFAVLLLVSMTEEIESRESEFHVNRIGIEVRLQIELDFDEQGCTVIDDDEVNENDK